MRRSRRNRIPRRRGRPGRHARRRTKERYGRRREVAEKLVGELRLHRDGYGFVVADQPGAEDVFIPARYIGNALHTDVVEVAVIRGKGESPEGRIIDIVDRRVKKIVGRLEDVGKKYRVVAFDSRVRRQVMVHPKHLYGARHGQDVVVRITAYPEGDAPMRGEIEKVIVGRGNLDAEEEVIITHNQLPTEFPIKVEKEADHIAEAASMEAVEKRIDLAYIPFITIDGENAKDFDDAVAVEQLKRGLIRLYVSIADVSHFVKPGSHIDREAYARGTSVYFPQRCLPMLPEVLSNHLCSLKADCKRFTVTAQLDIDPQGQTVRSEFYRSTIQSRRRMTYTEIKKILVEKDKAVRSVHQELIPGIELMEECFGRLREMRLKRGSLDFDLPEPEIIIDLEGEIDNIVKAERHVGHMMIEEFMIAANEAVAEFLTKKEFGCVYRVHEPPTRDALREFSIFAHNLGLRVRLGDKVPPRKLAKIIEQVRGQPEERLVNHKLLRSMQQAVYSPENIGHYGLASTCYCHFTSPIRRYPDLVVHRLLIDDLTNVPTYQRTNVRGLKEIAEHASRRERSAMQAEREMAKLYAALFMKDRIGEEFDGVVSHVTKFGFFVELTEFFVEGIVHVTSLADDFYHFDENGMRLVGRRHKKVIRIGDHVRVRVEEVSVPEKEVSFELVSHRS